MALPGPEQCLERGNFFFFTRTDPRLVKPRAARGKGERGNWDCEGVAAHAAPSWERPMWDESQTVI